MIDITLLGTSALMPLPNRPVTAAVLQCNGRGILFDCGEGTQVAGRALHAGIGRVDVIALTHYHGDHTFGLPGLLQTMNVQGRTAPLLITGPEGLEEALAPILQLTGATGFPILLEPLPPGGLRLAERFPRWPGHARLWAYPTEHRVPSQCYAFELPRMGRFDPVAASRLGVEKTLWGRLARGETVTAGDGASVHPEQVMGAPRRGLRFAFSGDTAPCAGLLEAARDADLVICEATFPDDAPTANQYGHMVFAQAGALAAQAGARRLWLAHFSQSIPDPEACLPLAAEHFPQAECGAFGKRITLTFDGEEAAAADSKPPAPGDEGEGD